MQEEASGYEFIQGTGQWGFQAWDKPRRLPKKKVKFGFQAPTDTDPDTSKRARTKTASKAGARRRSPRKST